MSKVSWDVQAVHTFQRAVKKVAIDPLAAGSDDGKIAFISTGIETQMAAAVAALKSRDGKMVAGLASGEVMYAEQNVPESSFIPFYSHQQKVSAVDVLGKQILSGSWDNTAILCDLETQSIQPYQHPGSVWAVHLVNSTCFVTGCADGHIRIFRAGKPVSELKYHTGPIRGMLIEANGTDPDSLIIYSVDNHGMIHKTKSNGELLASRKLGGFLFCICKWKDSIVVSGDSGMLFVLNDKLQITERVKLSSEITWDIISQGDELYLGSDDGRVYKMIVSSKSSIATDNDKGYITNDDSRCDENDNGDNASNNNSKNFSSNDASNNDSKIFKSNGFKYKIENDEVFVEKDGEWILLGEPVKTWDNQFKVELAGKNYTLPFNNNENAHEVATRFLKENGLSNTYHQEIVDFIHKNFKKSLLYKRYENIDLAGIEKILGQHPILRMLSEIQEGENYGVDMNEEKNVYKIEELLAEDGMPLFVVLDICKFLVAKKVPVDLSFLMRVRPTDRKEAMAFQFLLTNLVEEPPFVLDRLDARINKMRDERLLSLSDVHKYEANKEVKRNTKK